MAGLKAWRQEGTCNRASSMDYRVKKEPTRSFISNILTRPLKTLRFKELKDLVKHTNSGRGRARTWLL